MSSPQTESWEGYSLAERDRRWDAVRAGARAADLDCIFVPLGNSADARYLTDLRASSVVLPTDGGPAIAVTDRGAGSSWLPQTRAANRQWAEPMAQALLDAGMERARIGVAWKVSPRASIVVERSRSLHNGTNYGRWLFGGRVGF